MARCLRNFEELEVYNTVALIEVFIGNNLCKREEVIVCDIKREGVSLTARAKVTTNGYVVKP